MNCCNMSMPRHSSLQIICGLLSQFFSSSLWNCIKASKHAPRCSIISHDEEVIFQLLFGRADIFPDLKSATTTGSGILRSTDKELETDLYLTDIQLNINNFSPVIRQNSRL